MQAKILCNAGKLFGFFIIFCCLASGLAEGGDQERIPAGMEKMKIGHAEFVVPIGARFRKQGDLIILETASEYAARRLQEMEGRLGKMEERNKELEGKIKELEEALKAMRQSESTNIPEDDLKKAQGAPPAEPVNQESLTGTK